MTLRIFYTKLPQNNNEDRYERLLSLLPASLHEKNRRYVQWQDRWRNLLGKLLLADALTSFSLPSNLLDRLEYTYHGRPFLKAHETIDFNISHSGNYVICVIAKDVRVGIDIEEIKHQRFEDFANTMNEVQWQVIKNHDEPLRQFFNYWAIKESVIKADSRGLSLPLLNIHIEKTKATVDGTDWFLYPLVVDDNYSACLAANCVLPAFTLELIDYNEPGTK